MIAALALTIGLVSACSVVGPAPGSAAPVVGPEPPPVLESSGTAPVGTVPTNTGPTTTVSFQPDTSLFPNPERGWYTPADGRNYEEAAAAGFTLVKHYVRLDDYRNRALPDAFLAGLRGDFAAARGSGVKIILRFTYNFGQAPDAPLTIVLRHISQLEPLLHEYADSIAAVQAGFVGAWGEWHGSTNDLLTLQRRTQIVNALLEAVPPTRMLQIRYPSYVEDLYPRVLDAARAFDGSDQARIGLHNDCFLSTSADGATYLGNADRSYAQALSALTVMGGETCDLGGLWAYNDAASAISAMATYHWDYLNHEFWTPIIDKWRAQGSYEEVTRRLGYRYSLTSVTSPVTLQVGRSLGMELVMTNTGFGKLYNPRPLQIVLKPISGGADVTVTVAEDARKLLPAPGESATIDVAAVLPPDTPAGFYDVYLELPDASPHLRGDPRYSIRLANTGTWKSGSGLNYLRLSVAVE